MGKKDENMLNWTPIREFVSEKAKKLLNDYLSKVARHNHDDLYSALGHNHNDLYATLSGWNLVSAVTGVWTYSSVDDPVGVVTVPSGAADIYTAGMRIKLMNGGNTIYGIILVVADTSITFLHEIDPTDSQALYLMADSAITNIYYSPVKVPHGFPTDPRKWSVKMTDTTNRSQASPTANVFYNPGSLSITIPIGAWNVYFKRKVDVSRATAGGINIYSTLSSATDSETNSEFTFGVSNSSEIGLNIAGQIMGQLLLAAKTAFYPLIWTTVSGMSIIYNTNAAAAMVIMAVCAYL